MKRFGVPLKDLKVLLTLFVLCFFCGTIFLSCEKNTKLSSRNPITFTFYNGDSAAPQLFNDPVAKKITEKTGVTLDITSARSTTAQEIPMMIASGRFQDLIFAKSELSLLISCGMVIPLDDWVSPSGEHINLIEKYGKNFKELYGDQLVKLRSSDGHIYTFGTYEIKKAINSTTGSMQIQHAVLKELGYPRIKTLEDFSGALRAYIKRHPTTAGKKTIGLSLLTIDWHWFGGLSDTGNFMIGYPDDGQWIVNRETHQAEYKFLNPEMDQYYRWLNGLYVEGLLDPESFTQSDDVWRAKIASGNVLSLASPGKEFDEACKTLVADGMSERTYAYLPIVADSEKYLDPSLTDYGFSGGWGISISRQCKNVVQAFKFMDWMCSEEAQILLNWGIENINYEVVDGMRVVPDKEQMRSDCNPDYVRESGVGLWTYPFPQCGSGALDHNGDWMTKNSKERLINSYLPVEKETLRAYGVKSWTDLFPQGDELYHPIHGQIWQYQLPKYISDKIEEADNFVHKSLISCIINPPEEFDGRWDAMVEELKKMGMEKVGDDVTEIINKRLELWQSK